jgi:hypothetical protein
MDTQQMDTQQMDTEQTGAIPARKETA